MGTSIVTFKLPSGTDTNTLNKFVRGPMHRIQNPGMEDTSFTERRYWKRSLSGNS